MTFPIKHLCICLISKCLDSSFVSHKKEDTNNTMQKEDTNNTMHETAFKVFNKYLREHKSELD